MFEIEHGFAHSYCQYLNTKPAQIFNKQHRIFRSIMDPDLKKSITKEIKSLLINDLGIQGCISNIRSQNNDPYRVFTEIVTQNEKAHEMIGTYQCILIKSC